MGMYTNKNNNFISHCKKAAVLNVCVSKQSDKASSLPYPVSMF